MIEYELRPYQAEKAADVVKRARQGMADPGDVLVTLSAPTGAGKTIIAAAAIDELLFGDDTRPGDLSIVVLWISMSPTLNEQTADKFARASSKLASRTRIIDASSEFGEAALESGRIYFLNPQKLGKGARQYRAGNHRKRDLWDTLNGTFQHHGGKVLVFVDEAHLGTGKGEAGDDTYMAQLLNGTGLGRKKAPVVIGISATPNRFDKAVTGRGTTNRITVDVDDVRAGGLVKDQVLLSHPTEEIASDTTLLMEAARQRVKMAHLWGRYTSENEEPTVEPILLVQLPAKVPELTVAQWIDAIKEADRDLVAANFAQALEGGATRTFGTHDVRYVDPPRIQETTKVKVVLFKEALTTGWDCPRAEVLISLRSSKDETTITQLIGRTVRTPLAKKVSGDDELNAVRVYLPHFNQKTTSSIVARLRDGDDATAAEVIADPIRVVPNPNVPDTVWEAFREFSTWTRPVKTARSTTSRLVSASTVLSKHGVVEDAVRMAEIRIIETMLGHLEVHRAWVEDKVQQFEEVDYVTRAVDWLTGVEINAQEASLAIASRNIDDLFKQSKARMPDASASWLWQHLVNEGIYEEPAEAKLYVAALAQQADTNTVIEAAANALLQAWKQQHLGELALKGGQAQQDFLSVFVESKVSEQVTTSAPKPTSVRLTERSWPKHLLGAETGQAVEEGLFPYKPASSWEATVLEAELARESTVAWFRNPPGGPTAIAVPYGEQGSQRMLYPDFVIFTKRDNESIGVSVVDPHQPNQGDTLAKWFALGEYAKANADRLDRVWAVIDDKDAEGLLFLDLKDPTARAVLAKQAAGSGDIEPRVRKAFAEAGGRYT
jgi:type III restriction enzyme